MVASKPAHLKGEGMGERERDRERVRERESLEVGNYPMAVN